MNLLGQFVNANKNPYVHQSDLVRRLSGYSSASHSSRTSLKTHYSHHVDKKLKIVSTFGREMALLKVRFSQDIQILMESYSAMPKFSPCILRTD